MVERYKCILSARVANHLIAKGFRLTGTEPSRKIRGKLVFIFECTPELESELAELQRR